MLRFALILLTSFLLPSSLLANDRPLRLATTTSTANTGLMDYLMTQFTAETSIEVQVIAVGTGKALRLGREGDVDLVLVHAREAEDAFVAGGYGVGRADVMYNDFVIVGPASDPAMAERSHSAAEVLTKIHANGQPFVSRGDDSGTHKRELILWQRANRKPDDRWYREVGQGMGKTLQIANEMDAYTMTDRGTWLAYQTKLELKLLFQGDPPLFNPYGIIAVNPKRHPDAQYDAAIRLIQWITSAPAQKMIGQFRIKGQPLFVPLAKQTS